jgi:hypothetical protein
MDRRPSPPPAPHWSDPPVMRKALAYQAWRQARARDREQHALSCEAIRLDRKRVRKRKPIWPKGAIRLKPTRFNQLPPGPATGHRPAGPVDDGGHGTKPAEPPPSTSLGWGLFCGAKGHTQMTAYKTNHDYFVGRADGLRAAWAYVKSLAPPAFRHEHAALFETAERHIEDEIKRHLDAAERESK